MTTLAETGTIILTQAATREYARERGLGVEAARRQLTALLTVARRQGQAETASGAEGWRIRSRPMGLDIGVLVGRDGPLAVVTHVRVRPYQPRNRRHDA